MKTAVAGSAHIGNNVVLAGQTGVDGHVTIGDGAQIAGKSGVTKDIRPGAIVSGFPAQDHRRELRERAAMKKGPELINKINRLNEKVRQLELQAENHCKRSRTGGCWPIRRRPR